MTSSVGGPIDPAIVQRAAEWMARLWSGECSEAEVAASAAWRAQHPDHERAWCRLQVFEQRLEHVASGPIRSVLLDAPAAGNRDRRHALQALGLGAVAGCIGLWSHQSSSWQLAFSDHRTSVGDIRGITLPDGTQVVLDTGTSIDVRFSEHERRIVLHAGTIMVTSASDSMVPARPLLVQSREGTARAIGTRFSVTQADTTASVAVFEGIVEITPALGTGAGRRLTAGQRVDFSRDAIDADQPVDERASAWTRGVIVVERARLADLIEEIGRYRHGIVRCHPDVADLRVTGVFSLRDTDRALLNLTLGLPVDVGYRTRFWVTVMPRPPAS